MLTLLIKKSAITLDSYQIQPQDILQIRNLQNIRYIVDVTPVSGNPAIANSGGTNSQGQTFQVQEDSTVALPVIGHVKVVGLTRSQAQKLIEDIYRKKILVDPIIDLKIINLKVTILGEVKAQGNFPLIKDKTTLIELIGEAGGLTEKANQANIKIIRGDQKKPSVIQVDLGYIGSINDPKTVLQNGDIIYVAQNARSARSENLQNFSLLVQPVLLLFNAALIIYTFIHR